MTILRARELRVQIGAAPVVDGVDLDVAAGEAFGIVGESGSGKSMTALAVLGLLPATARLSARELRIAGQDALALSPSARRALGGRVVSMIFQDPMTALNPVRRVGSLLVEAIRRHRPVPREAAQRDRKSTRLNSSH